MLRTAKPPLSGAWKRARMGGLRITSAVSDDTGRLEFKGYCMAKFTLTPGTDHFTGVSGEGNEFEFRADTLQSTDVIAGTSGAFIDVMALSGSAPVAFGQFAGVSGIEQLRFDAPGSV